VGSHINKDGQFQSDKYPTCPAGKVPLSVNDPTAQDLLWEYAQRRRPVDAEFSDDLETALRAAGYSPTPPRPQFDAGVLVYMREAIEALREERDRHCQKTADYDRLTCIARNLRDAFEWLYPKLWNDAEFVPFEERTPENDWGRRT
jgi:hypothetical protein